MLWGGMLALSLMSLPSSPVLVLFFLSPSGFAVWPWPSFWVPCPLGVRVTMRAEQRGHFVQPAVCVCAGLCEDMPERQLLACMPLLRSLPRVPAFMLAMLLCALLVGFQSLSTLIGLLCWSRSPCPEGVALYGLRL